ncbi:hypothetical protein [Paraflavitalea sp. CAU 1676]|uniref:hypothetical protein n=1 Tax=Paraflavitalea sp. CAU 1676 TaxID=3032598 RepID=UPI0023DB6D8D|nr:hypothetical protein [Paraflavitalea sp. CAU 1676]MDF2189001.1 hypothetical protein [Paraflavitalea sp. CAU 1676]
MITYQWAGRVQQRPAMFLGATDFSGFQQLLEYLFEELIELARPGITLEFAFGQEELIIKVTHIDAAHFIHQLNRLEDLGNHQNMGVGVALTLSNKFKIEVINDGAKLILCGSRGKYDLAGASTHETGSRIMISMIPDKEVFTFGAINYQHINILLRKLAYLNPGVKIISVEDKGAFQCNVFCYKEGLSGQLEYLLSQKDLRKPVGKLNMSRTVDGYVYQVSCCYEDWGRTDSYIESYVNNHQTHCGGSLVDGVLAGLSSAIQKLAAEKGEAEIEAGPEKIARGLVLTAAIRGNDFHYAGSVRHQLDMPEIEDTARDLVFELMYDYLRRHSEEGDTILKRFRKQGEN